MSGAEMPENDITVHNWRKSSASGSSECVEVASISESVLVRDSKQNFPHALRFAPSEWRQFLSRLRAGKFEPCSGGDFGPRAFPWRNWPAARRPAAVGRRPPRAVSLCLQRIGLLPEIRPRALQNVHCFIVRCLLHELSEDLQVGGRGGRRGRLRHPAAVIEGPVFPYQRVTL